MRGGGPIVSPIFALGIETAKQHGINVQADEPNPAVGDCLFEAVVDNINHRTCFPEQLQELVQRYREDWCFELMLQYNSTAHYPGDNYRDEWHAAWNQQINPGEYNVDEFNSIQRATLEIKLFPYWK